MLHFMGLAILSNGWGGRIRTIGTRYQKLLPKLLQYTPIARVQ